LAGLPARAAAQSIVLPHDSRLERMA